MKQTEMKVVTPYHDVNAVLAMLADGLIELLGDQLVGLYLTGSLTYGDFDRGSGDIDFLVVLVEPLSNERLGKVTKFHSQIGQQFPEWAKRLEGSYITLAMLKRLEIPRKGRLYVSNGRLKEEIPDDSWFIDLYDLYQSGVALTGPEPKAIFSPVPIQRVRQASRDELHKYWEPKLSSPTPFGSAGYDTNHLQAYAVLTMCRILHRAKNDEVASKRVASKRAKQAYPEWRPLIEKAEGWQHGKQLNAVQETLGFIRFTLKQVG
jgi:hypothetical protein